MKIIKILIGLLLLWVAAQGQPAIPPDKEQLLKGDIADQTLIAETNGYPSPKKVLSLKSQIGLTGDQEKKISELMENLPVSSSIKGQEIVDAEQDLGKLFQAGKINDRTLRQKLEEIGKLRADLRFVHLQIYIKIKQILSFNQWEKLKDLQAVENK